MKVADRNALQSFPALPATIFEDALVQESGKSWRLPDRGEPPNFSPDQRSRSLRGQDLNLRPLGYESWISRFSETYPLVTGPVGSDEICSARLSRAKLGQKLARPKLILPVTFLGAMGPIRDLEVGVERRVDWSTRPTPKKRDLPA